MKRPTMAEWVKAQDAAQDRGQRTQRAAVRRRNARRAAAAERDRAWESEARLRDMKGTGTYEGPRYWP